MIFFPQDPLKRMRSRKLLEMILSREGLELLFWRDVPVCPEILSEKGPEQHALHRAVLHPPPGHGSARAGF